MITTETDSETANPKRSNSGEFPVDSPSTAGPETELQAATTAGQRSDPADRPDIRLDWFQRGLQQENFAMFEASLLPARDYYVQLLRNRLSLDSVRNGHLITSWWWDEIVDAAFENAKDRPTEIPLDQWLTTLVESLIQQRRSKPR